MEFNIFSKVTNESSVGNTSFDKLFDLNGNNNGCTNCKDGKDGSSITILSSSLDGSGNTIVYFSDGTNITVMKGNTGATGANGTNGVNGLDGLAGADGANGLNGTDGVNGTDGINGLDGANGTNGLDGNDGATGATGATGAAGTNGIDGTNGTNGINGTDGTDILHLPYYNTLGEIITPAPCVKPYHTYTLKYGCKDGVPIAYWLED